MEQIKNITDLEKAIAHYREDLKVSISPDNPESIALIKVSMATCSIAAGSERIFELMGDFVKKRGIHALVSKTGCMGYCYAEPTVEVTVPGKEPVIFGDVDERRADEIIESFIKEGKQVPGIIDRNYLKPEQV